jgi:hypothetical protein
LRLAKQHVTAMGYWGLLMLAACGTTAPSSSPAAPKFYSKAPSSTPLPEFYSCNKRLEHAELGFFEIRKDLTLEGAPYKPFNSSSYFTAQWSPYSLHLLDQGAGRNYHTYLVLWTGEDAATTSADVGVTMHLVWSQPQPKKYRVQLSRKGVKQPEPYVNLAFQTPFREYRVPATGNKYTGEDFFFSRVSDILAFAGADNALIATVYDEKGRAAQSMELNVEELRDGVAQMRKLMAEFESETRNFAETCQRWRDEIIVVVGANSSHVD